MKIPPVERRQGNVLKFLPLREITALIRPSWCNSISEFTCTSFSGVYFHFNKLPVLLYICVALDSHIKTRTWFLFWVEFMSESLQRYSCWIKLG